MHISRAPCGPLRPFVQRLWLSEESEQSPGAREYVVPTGAMHIVVRLREHPLQVYDAMDDQAGQTIGTAVVGGARGAFYLRDVSRPSCSVGAMLHPGASLPLLGVPAAALAERHTPLDDLWGGPEVDRIRERLLESRSPADRLDLFETVLANRLPRVRGIHPVVAHALERLGTLETGVGTVVRETGYSHRRFITLFRETVGLGPKRYCRIIRFKALLQRLEAPIELPWSEIALATGFSDQAHLTREFREIAGVTPKEFERIAPRHAHHLRVQV